MFHHKSTTAVAHLAVVSAACLLGGTQLSRPSSLSESVDLPAGVDALGYFSVEMLDDGFGNLLPTIRITGANLQIVNGLGTTSGAALIDGLGSSQTNGLGNLIVGYSEPYALESFVQVDRTGSHNIVTGMAASYSSYGGIVAGQWNTIAAPLATVTGGSQGVATGLFSSVAGGLGNTASGLAAAVGGGNNGAASGFASSVQGGRYNLASGTGSSATGGASNTAGGIYSAVSGGNNRTVTGHSNWRAGTLVESN